MLKYTPKILRFLENSKIFLRSRFFQAHTRENFNPLFKMDVWKKKLEPVPKEAFLKSQNETLSKPLHKLTWVTISRLFAVWVFLQFSAIIYVICAQILKFDLDFSNSESDFILKSFRSHIFFLLLKKGTKFNISQDSHLNYRNLSKCPKIAKRYFLCNIGYVRFWIQDIAYF